MGFCQFIWTLDNVEKIGISMQIAPDLQIPTILTAQTNGQLLGSVLLSIWSLVD